MFKVNNRNTRTKYEICSKLTKCQWRRSGVFVVNFEHISHLVLVFLLLILSREMPAEKNAKRWTENELELFAEVLGDSENNFAIFLEKLTLKKLANNEVFEHTKNTFEMEMDNAVFKQNNIYFKHCYKIRILKLRQKYK